MTSNVKRIFRPRHPKWIVNGCLNCYMSESGGDACGAFGLSLKNDFLVEENGQFNVVRGPELAAIASDGDGFTKGEELSDSEGAWRLGNDPPGDRGSECRDLAR